MGDIDFADHDLFIDGAWAKSSTGRTIERRNPANGALIGRYARASVQDVDLAVSAARHAFDDTSWPTLAAPKRAALLRRISELLLERADPIGRRISLELGKPLSLARNEVVLTAEVFEYYAALTLDQRSDLVSRHTPGALGLVLKEPVGVVAMITPWNFPLLLLSLEGRAGAGRRLHHGREAGQQHAGQRRRPGRRHPRRRRARRRLQRHHRQRR